MQLQITGRHMDMTAAIREYTEEKTSKLPRYFDRVSMLEVIAEKRDHIVFEVEMIAHVDHHKHIVAHSRGEDLYGCIDEAVDRMERQLTDHKEKLRNHKHSGVRA